MLSELKDSNICVGIKQSRRALNEGSVIRAFVAADADTDITRNFVADCRAMNIVVEIADSMVALGHAAGIDIGASVVSILKSSAV